MSIKTERFSGCGSWERKVVAKRKICWLVGDEGEIGKWIRDRPDFVLWAHFMGIEMIGIL